MRIQKTTSSRKHASRWSQGIRIQKADDQYTTWALSVKAYHCEVSYISDRDVKVTHKKSSTTVDTTAVSIPYEATSRLTGLVHHGLHWHVSDTLELVVDDQLGDKLNETEHVDSLSQRGNDERIPSSMGLV